MTDAPIPLNDAQRRALAIRLQAINERLDALRGPGVDTPLLDALQHGVIALATRTEANVADPPPADPSGVLFRIGILLDEIAPQRLSAYGALNEVAEQYLDETVTRLSELVERLQVTLRQSKRTGQRFGGSLSW